MVLDYILVILSLIFDSHPFVVVVREPDATKKGFYQFNCTLVGLW